MSHSTRPVDRPNILLFCVDQMQAACMGCAGHPLVETPNLDALAEDGVLFSRAYVNNPVCMPSRATIFTGRTPRDHGLLTNGCKLPHHVPTLPQALADAGYVTHSVGKLHLQPALGLATCDDATSWEGRAYWDEPTATLPSPYYGFQSADFTGGHVSHIFGDYRHWLDKQDPALHGYFQPRAAYHQQGRGFRIDLPEELHYNQWIADRTCDFVSRQRDADHPFFAWCSFPDPHFPFAACRPWSERYDPADVPLPPTWDDATDLTAALAETRANTKFADAPSEPELREITAQTLGMISHVDQCIGQVIRTLKDNGQWDRTVVAFISDHGEYLGDHALLTKGTFPYESLWRVPMIWRAPGGSTGGSHDSGVVSLLDVAPTVADFAGLARDWHETQSAGQAPRPGLAGRSLRARIEQDEPLSDTSALVEYDEDFHAGTPLIRQRGLVTDRYKLVTWAGQAEGLLFDLQEDPHETRNLWSDADRAAVRHDLMGRLLDRLTQSDRFDSERISGA